MTPVQALDEFSRFFILVDIDPLVGNAIPVQQEPAATGSTAPGGAIQDDNISFAYFNPPMSL